MMPVLSLKARLLAGSIAWIIVALVVTALLLTSLFRDHAERQFEQQMGAHLDQLLADIDIVRGAPALPKPMSDPRFEQPYSGLYWQVDGRGRTMLRSRSLWDDALPLPDDAPADGEVHRHFVTGPAGQHLMAIERKVSFGGKGMFLRAAVAGDLGPIEKASASFTRIVIVALASLGSGLTLLVAFQIWGGLRPLRQLEGHLGEVRAGRAAKLTGRYPGEIQPLVDELNALIDHSAEVIARGRAEAGNLAHALKTPLAILANAPADIARKGKGAAEAAELQAQIAAMRRQIDLALARTRAAASVGVLGATVVVGDRIRALVAAMRVLHPDRRIEIRESVQESLIAKVELQDFDEILGNLLDNGCKWARDRVEIGAIPTATAIQLYIDDDGSGLPPAQREDAFLRGYRLDEAVPGSGLGLAIVQDLVGRYGGSVRLEESKLGGLRAIVELPRADAGGPGLAKPAPPRRPGQARTKASMSDGDNSHPPLSGRTLCWFDGANQSWV